MLLDDWYDLGRELLHRVDHRAVRHIADGEINVHMPRPIKLYLLADPLRDTFCIANEEVLGNLFERFFVLTRHFFDHIVIHHSLASVSQRIGNTFLETCAIDIAIDDRLFVADASKSQHAERNGCRVLAFIDVAFLDMVPLRLERVRSSACA